MFRCYVVLAYSTKCTFYTYNAYYIIVEIEIAEFSSELVESWIASELFH